MTNLKKLSLLVSVTLVSGTAFAGVDSRSVSMGDTGAASSDYMSAVFSNPALAAMRPADAHFGAVLPFVSGNYSDKDNLISKISDFQDLTSGMGDEYSKSGRNSISKEEQAQWEHELADIMKAKNGVSANLTSGVALSFPYGENFTNTLFVKTDISVKAKQHVDPKEVDLDKFIKNKVASNNAYGFKDSDVALRAVAVTDLGVSIARHIKMPYGEFYVGFTPKMQQIAATGYDADVDTFDVGDFKPLDDVVKETKYNFDAGMAYSYDDFTVGYYAHNIMKRELNVDVDDHIEKYHVDPSHVIGVAYNGLGFTATADLDLVPVKTAFGEKTKYAKFGVEYNLKNWAQIRAGYKADLIGDQDVQSLGFGFKPFGKIGIDVAAQKIGEDNYGGSLQVVINM